MTQVEPGSRRQWGYGGMAVVGSIWAAFLLPPQLVAWDGASAPEWARRLDGSVPYDWVRDVAAGLQISDDYALFGALLAPSFLLIGTALVPAARVAGRWTGAVALLTVLGAPITVISYVGHDLGPPWDSLWGAEIPLLLAICICAAVAGVVSYRRHHIRGWWAGLLGSTTVVLVASTALFDYFPHGSLVGYGVEVAVLAIGLGHGTRQRRRE
ncbi:hypothetical protein ACGFIF_43365 [Kribbella sp. NPDC049174]|uniref:hypothetical protein n=1 Tax=Kribbella sp. NPDC049174 TaxID=3364112 RepID=UPI0037181E87